MDPDPARMEFAPPPTPGLVKALALAILIHALLLVILAISVQWKRGNMLVTLDVELWSEIPVEASISQPEPNPLHPAPITQFTTNETNLEPSPATANGIELVEEKTAQKKQHRLQQLDQPEQEKRSSETPEAKKPKVEMEPQDINADSDGIPLRDPT